MDNQLFRKKTMEKVSSPEQLHDYIRVSNPGVWMILCAIIVLLVGVCIWGIFGRLETTVESAAVVKNGEMTLYIKEEYLGKINEKMEVRIKDQLYSIGKVENVPTAIPEDFDAYALYLSGMRVGEWAFTATVLQTELPDGVYEAEIITEIISPMTFVMN